MKELWWRLAAASLQKKKAEDYYDAVRAEAEKVMDRGDTKSVYAPDGHTRLGAASMSNPKRKAEVHDADAFLTWVREHYPESVEMDADITGPLDEVKAVLFQHAKHLLTPRDRVAPKLRAAVMEASNLAGAPTGPGGEADVPGVRLAAAAESRVSFLGDNDVSSVVAGLVRSGAVKLPNLFDEPAAEDAE
ncbi:hypothetical protein [Amycolatopsis kentuckyensis]|uniref:hypothetical protein n=1 Tax=Amycolatopsis kentuckyensis TaxID=218823 RepID=UPI0035691C6D